jgi:leucyl/phenylalanyl-tRNA--protein transferase
MDHGRGSAGWWREPQPVPPCQWTFPSADEMPEADLVATGADLAPSTLIGAYRRGMFPMPLNEPRSGSFSSPLRGALNSRRREGVMGWWSPVERGVLVPDELRVSRSLRRSTRRWAVTVDQSFADVVTQCAVQPRRGAWISAGILEAYVLLHELGWAHSVEARDDTGRLVGGLYGVRVGRLFAGESMFHLERDASKVALVHLASLMSGDGPSLIDVQWATPHLESLGVVTVPRREYLRRLPSLVDS